MAKSLILPSEQEKLKKIVTSVRSGNRVELSGLWGSSAAFVISQWITFHGPCVTIITPDEQSAAAFREDLEFFLNRTVPLYPATDYAGLDEREERIVLSERLTILSLLTSDSAPYCIVTPASGLLAPAPIKEDLKKSSLYFKAKNILDLAELKNSLVDSGFRPSPIVTAPGEFSIRGDIVDIYPMAWEYPLRIELYDNEIESLREIDLESQLSVATLKEISIPLPKIDKEREWTDLSAHIDDNATIILINPDEIASRLKTQTAEFRKNRNVTDFVKWSLAKPGLNILPVSTGSEDAVEFKSLPARGTGKLLQDIKPSIEALSKGGNIKILCQTEAESERLEDVLKEQGVRLGRKVKVILGRLTEGFQIPEFGLTFINHHELLQRLPVRRIRKRRKIKARALDSFTDLKDGDIVVHLVYGIARYSGLKRMKREGGQEDFLTLVFDKDTILYVPASKIHLVEKYIGGEGHKPKLDKLGGKSFSRRKERVKEALRDVAADLLELQAVRDQELGVAYGPDDDLQNLFDASFPYQDTDDQVLAISEIKNDMESSRPMDRLLCGDVGFGKTEMAVRAAFKAATWGKQTAVLVPTTLLAEQHYQTFRDRLVDYPVTVAVLSRFKKRTEQKEIIEATRSGKVDILIGTHRILSQDVGFLDLGLLIIDEEQRFGVMHKERLKKLKRIVDVLSMTATPIPRTLHMAMVGLRDISSLRIPPEGRMPIHTKVVYRSDEVIRKALLAEVNRGGQAFYLHNRVRTIEKETRHLKTLLPDAAICYAHGQMPERELEGIMSSFILGEIDVLVCTTIIESGIDLPRVNTMMIDRADTFGLADLHQLRGRVGRGRVWAHAVMMIPKGPLDDAALRRLKAVEELSQLGAGFDIALKDLEIRGAGNLLGAEQHGHIAAVGYELYCRLMRQTILLMKGEIEESELEEVDLDIKVDAFLSSDYINDQGCRMEILRRLSRSDNKGVSAIKQELRDRFGRLPASLQRLLNLYIIRISMKKCGIKKILNVVGQEYLYVELYNGPMFSQYNLFPRTEFRFISTMKAHLYPPEAIKEPNQVLKFLKSRLMPLKKKV